MSLHCYYYLLPEYGAIQHGRGAHLLHLVHQDEDLAGFLVAGAESGHRYRIDLSSEVKMGSSPGIFCARD